MVIAVQLVPEGTSVQEVGCGVQHSASLCIFGETFLRSPGFHSPHPNLIILSLLLCRPCVRL
jgi:hypothetical protein